MNARSPPIEHIPATRIRRRGRTRLRRAPGATMAESFEDMILDMLGRIPGSRELACTAPNARAHAIGEAAARKAALVAGTLALPPGALGWLTVVPELFSIWRIQSQMVADIAATYGRGWQLTREQMMFCLFRHTAAQAMRDIAVRAGQRWLIQAASLTAMRAAARKIGIKLSQRGITHGIARWLPVVGAVGVGSYAWYDTRQIARTAIDLFAMESAAGFSMGSDEGALYD